MIKLFIVGINILLIALCVESFLIMQEVQCLYVKEMAKVKDH